MIQPPPYSYLDYETAVCVCAFGVGKSRDVNDLKSVEEVQRQLAIFGGKDNAHVPWTREEVVQTLEELVKRGTLIRIGDMYRRADRTCCRLITIDGNTEVMAVVEFFENATGIEYRFMLLPGLCDRYNEIVTEAIRRELGDKFSRGIVSVRQIAAVSAFGKMTLWTYDPTWGVSEMFGQGGAN